VGNDATSSEEEENDSEEWIYDAKGSRKRVSFSSDAWNAVARHAKRYHSNTPNIHLQVLL